MLKSSSALGSDRDITDTTHIGTIIRIATTIGLTIGTAGTAITATTVIIATIGNGLM
jgi:hypothetical protein